MPTVAHSYCDCSLTLCSGNHERSITFAVVVARVMMLHICCNVHHLFVLVRVSHKLVNVMLRDEWQDDNRSLERCAVRWRDTTSSFTTCSLFAAVGFCDANDRYQEFGLIDDARARSALRLLGVRDLALNNLVSCCRSIIISGWYAIWSGRQHRDDVSDDHDDDHDDDHEDVSSVESDDSGSDNDEPNIRDDG